MSLSGDSRTVREARKRARHAARFRPEKIAAFLEAAYNLETADQTWLAQVMDAARAVCGSRTAAHGAIYDASDVMSFRVQTAHFVGFSDEARDVLVKGLELITPAMVLRTFRSLVSNASLRQVSAPELLPMHTELDALGHTDAIPLNGLDPSGLSAFIALWPAEPQEPSRAEMATYRRVAHHLGAAYRCRRRLRESQPDRPSLDATDGAEAILDARNRVVHATGAAQTKAARQDLVASANARDVARTTSTDADDGLRRWLPLTRGRWSLVDSFERGGARYVVARENQTQVQGLLSLSDRERQAVAYLAVGQSTKETGYALGISDVTVRVLLGRAAAKLGVRSRAALLEHAEVRPLCPRPNGATKV